MRRVEGWQKACTPCPTKMAMAPFRTSNTQACPYTNICGPYMRGCIRARAHPCHQPVPVALLRSFLSTPPATRRPPCPRPTPHLTSLPPRHPHLLLRRLPRVPGHADQRGRVRVPDAGQRAGARAAGAGGGVCISVCVDMLVYLMRANELVQGLLGPVGATI